MSNWLSNPLKLARYLASFCASAMIVICVMLVSLPSDASTLTLVHGEFRIVLDRATLLLRSDAQEINIKHYGAYGEVTRRYRAVPLIAILSLLPATTSTHEILEAVSTDGFVAQIPLALVLASGSDDARAWLAIEPLETPWPLLPNKSVSGGPFFVVWQRAEAHLISPEYWPFQLAGLRIIEHPAQRWPELAVAQTLPKDHAARRGQKVFISMCLACHRIIGGGSGDMGPDLNLPMNPTEYYQPRALRQYLRDPASVRKWPGQTMGGYTLEQISNVEIDELLEYLTHMTNRRERP